MATWAIQEQTEQQMLGEEVERKWQSTYSSSWNGSVIYWQIQLLAEKMGDQFAYFSYIQ